jgi:hypothetical protein
MGTSIADRGGGEEEGECMGGVCREVGSKLAKKVEVAPVSKVVDSPVSAATTPEATSTTTIAITTSTPATSMTSPSDAETPKTPTELPSGASIPEKKLTLKEGLARLKAMEKEREDKKGAN